LLYICSCPFPSFNSISRTALSDRFLDAIAAVMFTKVSETSIAELGSTTVSLQPFQNFWVYFTSKFRESFKTVKFLGI
jgi:hypothetical protein